jgi:S-(hydroxymethyl)glutathione dehydrogenase/alcohol dehydrogenase
VHAIVIQGRDAAATLLEVEPQTMRAGEVRIHVDAWAQCSLDAVDQLVSQRPDTGPGSAAGIIAGHEVAGTIIEIASDVTEVVLGERVLIARMAPCRACGTCLRGQPALCLDQPIGQLTSEGLHLGHRVGGFRDEVVVAAGRALPLLDDVSTGHAATLGCTVLTGASAVRNAARLVPGERVVVAGSGPAAMAAIATSVLVGAGSVIALLDSDDADAASAATRLGAAHVLTPADGPAAAAVRHHTDGVGADAVLGLGMDPDQLVALWDATRPGGLLITVGGVAGATTLDTTDAGGMGRTLVSAPHGLADHQRDLSWLVPLAAQGRLGLDEVVDVQHGDLSTVLAAYGAATPSHRQLVHVRA